MDFDLQAAFNILVMVSGGMGGWILGRISKSLDLLDADVRNMPDKYVSKDDYRSDIADIKSGIVRIYDKLDGKADR